jgi:phi13 family phage major tail protein
MANKVMFGLKNVHYATFTISNGTITYDTPVAIPGAVELSLEPRGDMVEFYADDVLYYSAGNNQGYEGTLSIALIPEQFAIDCLGESLDEDDKVLTENVTTKGKPFALLFEFDGDEKATRHVLYNCSANRPTVGSSTKTDTVEPQPNELTFIASARLTDGAVKTKTTSSTPDEVYNNWYSAVYTSTPVAVTGVVLLPESLSLEVDEVRQLAATVLPLIATNKAVTWSSSDETKATVSSAGLVTGIAAGEATITVTTVDGSKTDTCTVTVTSD